jgi:succinoglycan biosynthesis protein ExoA
MSHVHSSANNSVDVSVLTPVLNEARHLRETVTTMRAQRFDGQVEFLFMDGGSADATRSILEELARDDPRIRVLDNPGRQVTHGLNVGLRHARGEFVARMDAHAHYPPEYLKRGVERLGPGDVEWVAGPPIPHGEGRWSRRVALALGSWLGLGGSRKWDTAAETDLDTGVFGGVWRRTTLERHGGWDEGWNANEDAELAARHLAGGGRIVGLPQLAAHYVPRDSLRGLARQYFRYGYYRVRTARRHPHSLRRSHVLIPGMVLTTVAALVAPKPLQGPARAGVALYAATLVGESVRLARGSGGKKVGGPDAAALPAVFATMHAAWGVGFLAGSARFGPPLMALARLASPSRREP